MNRAARIAGVAKSGAVWCSSEAWTAAARTINSPHYMALPCALHGPAVGAPSTQQQATSTPVAGMGSTPLAGSGLSVGGAVGPAAGMQQQHHVMKPPVPAPSSYKDTACVAHVWMPEAASDGSSSAGASSSMGSGTQGQANQGSSVLGGVANTTVVQPAPQPYQMLVDATDLGRHRLKGISDEMRIFDCLLVAHSSRASMQQVRACVCADVPAGGMLRLCFTLEGAVYPFALPTHSHFPVLWHISATCSHTT